MYIESATDLVAGRQEYTYGKTGNSYGGAGQEQDSGWVAAVRIYVTDTDRIYGCLQACSINLSVSLVLFVCSYCLLCLPRLYAGLTPSL
jgi:hypothetical protein